MDTYIVYIRTDSSNRVLEINSSAFLADTIGWTQIDEGWGDRYHHAQGNYLDGPLYDDNGIPRYKLDRGRVVERTEEEIAADLAAMPALEPEPGPTGPTVEQRVSELEEALDMILEGVTGDEV